MSILITVLLVLALACFITAIFNARINWIALGLVFVVLTWLIPRIIH